MSILPGRKGEFPFGRRPKLFLRSSEDLTSVQPVPPKNVRVVGRGQRILATLQMSELFGSSGGGHLELQVADVKAGASAWVPLQPLFLELPEVSQVRLNKSASRLEGPSLETIESVASSPAGPWAAFTFSFQGDLETGEAPLPSSDGSLFLKLYGWPNQLIRLQAQLPPNPAPLLPPAAGTTKATPGNPGQTNAK
jgi:hypothetical protein